jgi:hypothetical protein
MDFLKQSQQNEIASDITYRTSRLKVYLMALEFLA